MRLDASFQQIMRPHGIHHVQCLKEMHNMSSICHQDVQLIFQLLYAVNIWVLHICALACTCHNNWFSISVHSAAYQSLASLHIAYTTTPMIQHFIRLCKSCILGDMYLRSNLPRELVQYVDPLSLRAATSECLACPVLRFRINSEARSRGIVCEQGLGDHA